MLSQAFLDVRVLPWKARPRVMKADTFREAISQGDPISGADDIGGVFVMLALWVVLLIAAPLVVLVLAVLLLSVEIPIVIALGVVLLIVRFTGIVPWTVLVVDQVSGEETRETFRFMPSALRRIREINHDRRVQVRWHWV